jgi:hypothetical protein
MAGFSRIAELADPLGGVVVGVQEIAIDQTANAMTAKRECFTRSAYLRVSGL